MKMRVKSLDPLGLGKTFGVMYGGLSLLFIPLLLVMIGVGALADNDPDNPFKHGIGIGLAFVFIIVLPVIYGAMAFVMGALTALLHNLVSRWIGGIVMEIVPANLQPHQIQSEPPYPLVPPTT